jgi:cytochrome c oxidase cbb3-type subunit 4
MDINLIREAVTVLSFAMFIGIVLWAWSSRNKGQFDEAARLPFTEDDDAGEGGRR